MMKRLGVCALLVCAAATAPAQVISQPGPYPIADVIFVLDGSSSINAATFGDMKDAVVGTIGMQIPMSQNYRIGVVQFDDAAVLEVPLTYTSDPALPATITGITKLGGSTSVYNGVELALMEFTADHSAEVKIMVLITDACGGIVPSIPLGDDLRDLGVRVVAGCIDDVCEALGQHCPTPWPNSGIFHFTNTPRNPAFSNPPRGPELPGWIGCISDGSGGIDGLLTEEFLTFSLCPVGNWLEPDLDGDRIPDVCGYDCNGNGVPDIYEPDCDGDGLPDDCEIDCDNDGIPDDCDTDRDGDGIPDDIDPVISPICGACPREPGIGNPGGGT